MKKKFAFLIAALMLLTMILPWKAVGQKTTYEYVLVTNISQLSQGDVVLITNSKSNGSQYALGTTQNNNNRKAESVSISSNVISTLGNAQEITLETKDNNGKFTFKVGANSYLYAANSSNGSSNLLKSKNDNAIYWQITINTTSHVAGISDETSSCNGRKYMKYNYNNGSPIFSCYGSSDNNLFVFKKQESGGGGSTPTVTISGTDISNNAASFTYNNISNHTATVTYSNFASTPTSTIGVYTDAECNTTYDGSDFTAAFAQNSITIVNYAFANANSTSSPRTFYMRATANNAVNSNIVAVSQAAAPTLYTVNFALDGGTFVPNATFTSNPMSLEAGDYTLPSATKDGYLFVSWKDGNNNEEYYAGASYTLSGNVTLTAQWEALDYNNTYTSGEGLLSTSGGTSASTCKVKIYNVEYDGIKAGTGNVSGAWKVTVPINTTKLHLHFASWSSDNVTLTVSPSDYSESISLTKNSGISGNSTTYPWGTTNTDKAPSSDDHHKVITFEDPLEEAVTLTFTATGGNRFVVWGVNAEMSTDPYITAADVDIANNATSGSITYTVHNIPSPAGNLTASTTSDWLYNVTAGGTVSFNCTANPNAVERTATVTLTYSYGDDETTSIDVTVTQAPKVVNYTYTLATSIESGRHYILVGYEGVTPYAMGAQNGNVRNAISITDEGDDVVSFTSDKGVREIVINGPEIITKNDKPVEVYTLYDAAETGYVYASSSSSNNIGTRTYNTGADSQWKIVFEEENSNFVVTAQGTNSRNILKYNYNGGNPRFSCYGSGTSLTTLLYLYVKNEVTPQYDFYMDIAAWTVSQTTGDENKTDGWYFIASPVNGDIDPEDVDNMLTADENVYHTYDLYRLSGNTLENYRNENTHDFVIANGNGYLYANKNNTTLKFSGSSIKIYSTDDNIVTPSHSGWNLIGNPYTFPVKVSRAFSELNNGSAVNSMDANSIINPGAGIIVYGTEDVTFTKYEPTDQSSGPSNINIMLAQQVASRDGSSTTSVAIDNAVVSFNSNSRLPKFTLLEGNAKLYIPQNGEDYAITFSNRQGDMPLNFKTTETGNYTISFEGNNMNLRGIYLIDMLAGQEIDLSVNPSYTFIGSPVDKAERFKIVFKNVGSNGEDIFAYQNGNDIIVSGEGELQIFDVTGRSVMTTTISGVETINVPTMGVYIFRLIGSEIKTQKIVVR